MPVPTALYVDFMSAHSYRVWRWLSLLEERDRIQVRPYLAERDRGGSEVPWDRREPSLGFDLLALGELARDSGPTVHRGYVDAAFTAAQERRDLGRPEAWLALATEAGLDLDAFAREGDRWRAEVGLWHAEAQDELGITAVPSLVFDEEVALLVRLGADVTDAAAARRLLSALADLATLAVVEVRATR
jgi:predicted DsbA family dithiol-disulfide isomerase